MSKKLTLFLLLSIQPSLASFNQKTDTLENEQKQSYITVVDGYIRNEQKQLNNDKIVPSAVNQIILKYYFDEIFPLEYLYDLKGHQEKIMCLYYSLEDKTLFSASEDAIKAWVFNSEKGRYHCTNNLRGNGSFITSLDYDSQEKVLFLGDDNGAIKVCDIKAKQCSPFRQVHTSAVGSLAYNPEEKVLFSGSSDKTIKEWNTKTYECTKTLAGSESIIMDLAYNPKKNCLFSAKYNSDIDIWDTKKHSLMKTIKGNKKELPIKLCCDSKRNRLFCGYLSSYLNGGIKIWDVEDPKKPNFMKLLGSPGYLINSLAYNAEKDILFSGYTNGAIKVWDTENYRLIKTFNKKHKFGVNSIAYNAEENFVFSVGCRNTIKVWGAK